MKKNIVFRMASVPLHFNLKILRIPVFQKLTSTGFCSWARYFA